MDVSLRPAQRRRWSGRAFTVPSASLRGSAGSPAVSGVPHAPGCRAERLAPGCSRSNQRRLAPSHQFGAAHGFGARSIGMVADVRGMSDQDLAVRARPGRFSFVLETPRTRSPGHCVTGRDGCQCRPHHRDTLRETEFCGRWREPDLGGAGSVTWVLRTVSRPDVDFTTGFVVCRSGTSLRSAKALLPRVRGSPPRQPVSRCRPADGRPRWCALMGLAQADPR
jgi:hypothetical protein